MPRSALRGAALADTPLEFVVLVEPDNYDCHANMSFAFLHPIAPHYSTLLKFDAPDYPQIVGDLAESWSVSPDRLTYTFKLRPGVLFHDGSKLTSTDVKASYERMAHPPRGVLSVRKVDYASIAAIDTPDPLTVVFRLRWPDAAMLANFASPWNCIYSAAKLAADPQFPKTHILGTGPFVFAEHVKGQYWRGVRWDKYFWPGRPYLDGYRADFMTGPAVMKAYKSGKIAAEFRGITPVQRDELLETLGDRIKVSESPWLSNLLVVFNTKRAPFNDARVRRALSLAIDRWGAAAKLQDTTFLKYVGGVMRPGSNMATPESELVTLPGFARDIAASREEAKRLLDAAGVHDLGVPMIGNGDGEGVGEENPAIKGKDEGAEPSIDEAERDGTPVICNPAARERPGIDLHLRLRTKFHVISFRIYRSDEPRPACFFAQPDRVHVVRRYPSVIYSSI